MTEKQSEPAVSLPEHILTLIQQGGAAWREQRFDDARGFAEQALSEAHEAGSAQGALSARHLLANIAFNQCDDEKSRAMHEKLLVECKVLLGF